jgi:hypothetical protein
MIERRYLTMAAVTELLREASNGTQSEQWIF